MPTQKRQKLPSVKAFSQMPTYTKPTHNIHIAYTIQFKINKFKNQKSLTHQTAETVVRQKANNLNQRRTNIRW